MMLMAALAVPALSALWRVWNLVWPWALFAAMP